MSVFTLETRKQKGARKIYGQQIWLSIDIPEACTQKNNKAGNRYIAFNLYPKILHRPGKNRLHPWLSIVYHAANFTAFEKGERIKKPVYMDENDGKTNKKAG